MVIYLILLITSALTAVFGLCRHFGKKAPLFCVLITAGISCFMMGHLCETLSLFVADKIPEQFHIGMLARVGGFAFLFSASYAQMDGLVDDNAPTLRKYRLAALLAPILIGLLYLPVLLSELSLLQKIIGAILVLSAALPAYYNLKHLIVPDVSMGIIASIRGYSALALLLEIVSVVFLVSEKLDLKLVNVISGVVLAVTYPCTWIAMEKGRKKWTI